jgi:hypothetical protein
VRRAFAVPVAVVLLAALAGCPSKSDTTPPWPSPTITTPGPQPITATPTTPPRTTPADEDPPVEGVAPPARKRPAASPSQARTTGETDPTEPVTGAGYDTCAELRHDYPGGVASPHPAYEPTFDPDRDGWACETPGGTP